MGSLLLVMETRNPLQSMSHHDPLWFAQCIGQECVEVEMLGTGCVCVGCGVV